MRLHLYSSDRVVLLQTGVFGIETNEAGGGIDLYAKPSQQN